MTSDLTPLDYDDPVISVRAQDNCIREEVDAK